ncbi:MAG: stalk domain-containing protein [Clostridiaceae bacterium]|jgi:cell division protein FtsI/penicillin-binding protein 2|nr:stalk domain-containing protein [Clostridiaceae bacterium]
MIEWKRKLSVALVVTIVFALEIMSVANADNIAEKVQAYMGVKVQYNGQELAAEKQPYIINDTTYVPLRMLMDNFGKDISYDQSSNKVIIKDKESTNEKTLKKTIEELNTKVAELSKENAALKSENTALTTKNTSLTKRIAALEDDDEELTDIEDELYEDYEDAGDDYFGDDDIVVYISIDGDEDDLEFEIYLDFDDSNENEDLTDLSTSYIKSLLRAVYTDIEEYIEDTDYEDADITGVLVDDDYEVEYDGSSFDYSW